MAQKVSDRSTALLIAACLWLALGSTSAAQDLGLPGLGDGVAEDRTASEDRAGTENPGLPPLGGAASLASADDGNRLSQLEALRARQAKLDARVAGLQAASQPASDATLAAIAAARAKIEAESAAQQRAAALTERLRTLQADITESLPQEFSAPIQTLAIAPTLATVEAGEIAYDTPDARGEIAHVFPSRTLLLWLGNIEGYGMSLVWIYRLGLAYMPDAKLAEIPLIEPQE